MSIEAPLPLRYRFAAQMLRLRVARGWSQEELASRAGLHRNYIGQVERGNVNLGLDNVERIAQAFEVSALTLLSEPGSP